MVSHFQKLFDVTSLSGVFPRMNEVYTRLGEMTNIMRNLQDILQLGTLQLQSTSYLYPLLSVCVAGVKRHRTKTDGVGGFVPDDRTPPAQVVNHVARLASSSRIHDLLGDDDIDRLSHAQHTMLFVISDTVRAGMLQEYSKPERFLSLTSLFAVSLSK